MAEKKLNTRIIHKHETEANWLLSSLIPLQGELIVYDKDSTHDYERIKIGDGVQNVNSLPFIDDTLRAELVAQIDVVDDKVNEVSTLVGDTAVSEQISAAIEVKADVVNGTYIAVATTTNGAAYAATVPGITTLSAGISFIMIPGSVSTTKGPTLNVNGLGDKYIRRRLSSGATVDEGYTTAWLTKNKPFRVMYDGTQWVVEGHNKPVAADIYGAITATYDVNGNVIVDTYAMKPKVTTISLPAASWTGDAAPYSQVVSINAATENSKIDLQPSATQVVELQETDIALMAENDSGIITVYALGGKPTTDYSIQAMITEVALV